MISSSSRQAPASFSRLAAPRTMTGLLLAASCPRPCLIASVSRPPHCRDRRFQGGDAMLGGEQSPDARREAARLSSVEATLNRTSKWLVAGGLTFAALWKRDVEVMWVFLGAIANRILTKFLKKTLNHERPTNASRSDPGMPSAHAQSIFYAGTILILSLLYWIRTNNLAMILVPAILSAATYLSWLRVSHGLHTLNQVLVGAVVGSTFGGLWFVLWHSLVREAVPTSPLFQNAVVLGSAVFCVGYVIRHYFRHN